MHFRDRFSVVAFNDVEHLLQTHFPSFVAMGIDPAVGAEMTGIDGHIGGFNMEVRVKISGIAMESFAYIIGEGAHKARAGFFEKQQRIFIRNPDLLLHFVRDGSQLRVSIQWGPEKAWKAIQP